MVERLIAAGYPEVHVVSAADRLEAVGIIDDERLARSLVESRDRARQRGDRALAAELRRRGVPEDLAARVLAERADAAESAAPLRGGHVPLSAEERAAYAAAAKVRLRRGDARAEVQRVAQALARRGFPAALSWRIARERVDGAGEDVGTLDGPNDREGGE